MKKFNIAVLVIFITAAIIGIVIRNSYTEHDIKNPNELDEFVIFDFYEKPDEQNIDDADNYSQIEEGQTLEGYANPVEIEDDNGDEIVDDNLIEEEEYYSEVTLDVLSKAPYILKVEGELSYNNYSGMLVQDAKVVSVIKGDKDIENKMIEIICKIEGIGSTNSVGYNSLFDKSKDETMKISNGYVNLMKKNKEYIVFLNPVKMNKKEIENKFYLSTLETPYFCTEDIQNRPAEMIGSDVDYSKVKYSEVKDSEFFVKDSKSLEVLLDLKKSVLEKYNN